MTRLKKDTDVRIGPSLQGFIDVLTDPIPTRRPSIKVVIRLWRALVNWHSALDRINVENIDQRYVVYKLIIRASRSDDSMQRSAG